MLSPPERLTALRIARRAIEEALSAPSDDRPVPGDAGAGVWSGKRGVFVTIKRFPDGELRGCIGYPLPVLPLGRAVERAAVAAATEDPRFPPMRASDLPRVILEVSVLTVPEAIRGGRPEAIASAVRVGRDGLIVEGYGTSGLLLPQVAPEQGWTPEEFLSGTCEKAGLPFNAWRRPGVIVRRFEAQVFREASPGGELVDEPPVSADAGRSEPRS